MKSITGEAIPESRSTSTAVSPRIAATRARWGFLTNHAIVLVYVVLHPESTVRAVSADVGITERATLAILRDLDEDGIVDRHRDGRRNTYSVNFGRLSAVRRGGSSSPLTPRLFVDGIVKTLFEIGKDRAEAHVAPVDRLPEHELEERVGTFGFFTNHMLVLLAISRDHTRTVRELSASVGLTERAIVALTNQMEAEGIVTRTRDGRRNVYAIDFDAFREFRGWSFGAWEIPPQLIDVATKALRALSVHRA
jgi:DNA-binding MarR family transcriptional regulator